MSDICPSRDDAQPHIFEHGRCVLCLKPQCTCKPGEHPPYRYCPAHGEKGPSHEAIDVSR
jgi:hypothetical protein